MPTIEEIARRANVSKTTVSFVLNSKPGVSPDTAAHVRRVMEEMNYVPSALAQRFASRRSMAVALVTLPYPQVFRDPQHHLALDAVHNTLEENGYALILATSGDRFIAEKKYATMLRSGQVDGLLLLEPTLDQEYLKELAADDAPVVVVNSDASHIGLDFVRTDDVAIGRMAADYLVGLGHQHVGFVAGADTHASARDRKKGFLAAMASHGYPVPEECIHNGSYDTSEASGRDGCCEILAARPETTAIFCCNDTMALGALRGAGELDRSVPDTLSLIGVDDNPTSTYCRPQLTSIRQPAHENAKQATQILLNRLMAPKKTEWTPSTLLLPPTLVERDSCAPPPAK